MNKEDFLKGLGETPSERESREIREEWKQFYSENCFHEEIEVLFTYGLYDGPTGDA